MSDTAHSWELSKENIGPRKSGRSGAGLRVAVTAQDHTKEDVVRDELQSKVDAFEAKLSNEDEDDPLSVWVQYLDWCKDACQPQDVLKLHERCTLEFTGSDMYNNDARFLRVWMSYADMCRDPLDIFEFLEGRDMFQSFARFYEARADAFEHVNSLDKAASAYELGINRSAQPVERLKKRYKEFQHRAAEKIKQTAMKIAEKAKKPPKTQRAHLAKLSKKQAKTGDRASKKNVPTSSIGAGGVTGLSEKKGLSARSSSNKSEGFTIFTDENDSAATASAQGASTSGWTSLPPQAQKTKENTAQPGKWNEAKVKQKKVKTGASKLSLVKPEEKPEFDVYVEPACVTEAEAAAMEAEAATTNASAARSNSTSVRLREHLDAPATRSLDHLRRLQQGGQGASSSGISAQSAAEPVKPKFARAQPKRREQRAYDADMLKCSGQELSFEEVRAVRMAYHLYASPVPQPHRTITPISSAKATLSHNQSIDSAEQTPTDSDENPVRKLQFEGVFPTPQRTPASLGRAPLHPGSTPRLRSGLRGSGNRGRAQTPARTPVMSHSPDTGAPPSIQSENTQTFRPSPTINTKIALNDIMSMFSSPLPFEASSSTTTTTTTTTTTSGAAASSGKGKRKASPMIPFGASSVDVSVPVLASHSPVAQKMKTIGGSIPTSSLTVYADSPTPTTTPTAPGSGVARPKSSNKQNKLKAKVPLRPVEAPSELDQENIGSPRPTALRPLQDSEVLQPKMTMRDAILAQLAADGESAYVHIETEEMDSAPAVDTPPEDEEEETTRVQLIEKPSSGFTIFSDEMEVDNEPLPAPGTTITSGIPKPQVGKETFTMFRDFDDDDADAGPGPDENGDDGFTVPKFDTGVFTAGQDFGAATLSPEDTIRISRDLLNGEKVPMTEIPRALSSTPKVALPTPSRAGPTIKPVNPDEMEDEAAMAVALGHNSAKAEKRVSVPGHDDDSHDIDRSVALDMSHTFKSFATPGGGLAGVSPGFSRFSSVSAIDQIGDTSFCLSPLTPGTVEKLKGRPAHNLSVMSTKNGMEEDKPVTSAVCENTPIDTTTTTTRTSAPVSAPVTTDDAVVDNLGPMYPPQSPVQCSDKGCVDPFAANFHAKVLSNVSQSMESVAALSRFPTRAPTISDFAAAADDKTQLISVGTATLSVRAIIGRGSSAVVYEVEQREGQPLLSGHDDASDAPTVAMKVARPGDAWELYISEQVRQRVSDPDLRSCFTQVYRMYAFNDATLAFTTYHDQGSLSDIITLSRAQEKKNPVCMEETLAAFYGVELVKILQTLHAAGILHGSVSPDNVMIRNEPTEERLANWQVDGSGGWAGKGLCLIDYDSCIDLQALPSDVVFTGTPAGNTVPFPTELTEHKYHIDAFGVANTLHQMIFGCALQISHNAENGRYQMAASSEWKRGWNNEMWTAIFDALLNVGSASSPAPFSMVREKMEAFLASKASKVKMALIKQNVMVHEQR